MTNRSVWTAILCACVTVAVPQIGWTSGRELRRGEFRPGRLAFQGEEEVVSVRVGPNVSFGPLVAYANHDRLPELPAIMIEDIVRLNPGLIRFACGRTAHTPRTVSRNPSHWLTCASGAAHGYGHAIDFLTYRVPRRHVPTALERIASLQSAIAVRDRAESARQEREQTDRAARDREDQTRQAEARANAERQAGVIVLRDHRIADLETRQAVLRANQVRTVLQDLAMGAVVLLLMVFFWQWRFKRRQAKILEENNGLLQNAHVAFRLKEGAIQAAERSMADQAEAHQRALGAVEADANSRIISERETLKDEHAKAEEKIREQARREANIDAQARARAEEESVGLRKQLDDAAQLRRRLSEEKSAYDHLTFDLAKLEKEMRGYQDLIDRHEDLPDTASEIAQLRALLGDADQKRFDLQSKIQEVSQLLAADFEIVTGLPFTTQAIHQKLDEQMKDLFRVRVDAEAAKEVYDVLNESRRQRIGKLTQDGYDLQKIVESLRAENEILKRRMRIVDDSRSLLWSLDPKEITRPIQSNDQPPLDGVGSLERSLGLVVYRLLEELREDQLFPMQRPTQVDFVHLTQKATACCECREQFPLLALREHFLHDHNGIPMRHRHPTNPLPPPDSDE